MDLPAELPPVTPRSCSAAKVLLYVFCGISLLMMGLMTVLLLTGSNAISSYVLGVYSQLQALASTHKPSVLGLLTLLMLVNNTFILPFQSFLGIFTVMVLGLSAESLTFLFLMTCGCSYLLFLTSKCQALSSLVESQSQQSFISAIRSETKTYPYKTCLAVNMLLIPPGLKDVILALVETPNWIYVVCLFLNTSLFVLRTYLVVLEISDLEGYLSGSKPPSQSPLAQWLSTISMFLMIAATIFVSIYFSAKARKFLPVPSEEPQGNVPASLEGKSINF